MIKKSWLLILALSLFTLNAQAKTQPFFVPTPATQSMSVTDMIVSEIGKVHQTLEVNAYNLTTGPIADALLAAGKRGVKVQVLQDYVSSQGKGSAKAELSGAAGIDYATIKKYKISHSKIMILDGVEVLEGSFNFSTSAQKSNAENCVIISGPEEAGTVAKYIQNFNQRWLERDGAK